MPELPKTRSGKIMRRLLRDVADGYYQTDQLIQARLDKFIGVMREE